MHVLGCQKWVCNKCNVVVMAVPPDTIKSFGYSTVSSAAPLDALHKDVKAGVQYTNRHKHDVLNQVLPLPH